MKEIFLMDENSHKDKCVCVRGGAIFWGQFFFERGNFPGGIFPTVRTTAHGELAGH